MAAQAARGARSTTSTATTTWRRWGARASWPPSLLETAPLRLLYRDTRFLTISDASARDIAAHGIPREQIDVGYIGVELEAF